MAFVLFVYPVPGRRAGHFYFAGITSRITFAITSGSGQTYRLVDRLLSTLTETDYTIPMFCFFTLTKQPDNMKRYAWIVAPVIIMLYCCNAEKKVLNNEKKTQNVVNAWLKAHPLKIDTNFVFLPGDTTTTLLVNYDTTTVHDTVANVTEKVVTKTRTVTNTVHDTVKVTIGCSGVKEPCALLKAAQDGLASKMSQYDDQVLETKRERLRADGWKLKFWGVIIGLAILVALVICIKLFKPRMPFT